MAESVDAGKQISPSYSRPTPHPRKPNGSQPPPALPEKQSASSEREVETRLGMFRQSSFPITPPSPRQSPPSLPERRPAPKPPPRSDERNEEASAALAKGKDTAQIAGELKPYVNKSCVNTQAMSTFSVASCVPSSVVNDPLTESTSEQTEEVEMRSKLPGLDDNSGMKGNRTTLLASQFIDAVQKSVKSDKPPQAAQKPGRLVVSTVLADKLGVVLSHRPTVKPVEQKDDLPDVGIDVISHDSKISPTARKPSTEDTKGVL